jgi:GntR family transcriptional repressor for pyruvate dehydrogenase complex
MSTIHLTPVRRSRLADALYGQLLMRIVNGDVAEGDRLPSEAEIGKMFGASRPVVRQALMQLQVDGLVYSRKGAGTFVRMRPPARLGDFAEPRSALESEAARLAAMRRTRNHLKAIKDAARALEDAFGRRQTGHEEDFRFHMAVAEATDNELFARLLEEMADIVRGSMAMGLSLTRTGSDVRRNQVLKEHWQIADAITARDADTAALYMRFHLAQTRIRATDARSEL